MNRKDRELMKSKLKASNQLLERSKSVLLSHYATSSWGEMKPVVFVEKCHGSKVADVDGNEYLDMCLGYGPVFLGHGHPVVVEAAREAIETGSVHGLGHEYEVEFAERMTDAVPFADMVTFTNSGTEATMHALKIARAYTGKNKVGKFEGSYHGTHDYVQISGRGMAFGPVEEPLSVPVSTGIPLDTVRQVITLSYNQPETFDLILKHKDDLAAIILEPVPTCCPIEMKEFIQQIREITNKHHIILIFDEVLSGFRYNYGSISKAYGIEPDLSTFGKIIGGGFPVGAITGSRKFLQPMITTGDIRQDLRRNVFIVGTFNGNPVTCAAGSATLKYLKNNPGIYTKIEELSSYVIRSIEAAAKEMDLPFQAIGPGSWFLPFFSNRKVGKPRDVSWSDNSSAFSVFREYMIKNGVLVPDVPLMFFSASHTKEDCDTLIQAIRQTFQEMY
ncbi:aspartate aminotransferase family protein [Paenibacillus sp. TH7-28]